MLELDRKMTTSAVKTSRPSRRDVGVLFSTLLVVSFVLQISFLGSPSSIQEAARVILEIESDNTSASALRRCQQTQTDEPDQKTREAEGDTVLTKLMATTSLLASMTESVRTAADKRVAVAVPPQRRSRVLVGIFSADFPNEEPCRQRQRGLLQLYPHVCSLDKYLSEHPADCHLVYTFVLGGNPDAPSTELLDDSSRPWLLPNTTADNPRLYNGTDILSPDVTLLNIQENMNDGKSQTWFSYAATLVEEHSIDYIAKQDTDTILYLDKFFDFVDIMLPPAPYNYNILAGTVVDKHWWGAAQVNDKSPSEKWFIQRYGALLHLYVSGQWYLRQKLSSNKPC